MILIAIPQRDFDPTEAAVPWKVLRGAGVEVEFATPSGGPGAADERVLTGRGFGPLSYFFAATASGAEVYREMTADRKFANPIAYDDIDAEKYDGLILPGGHAPGMRDYLESETLQRVAARFFEQDKPVGAICHGVIVLARAKSPAGRSVLHGRKTTALIRLMELPAWLGTRLWLGNYFRTYSESVQTIVTRELESPADFAIGPLSLRRDSAERPEKGFAVVDGNYISARWPGDAYRFAHGFLEILQKYSRRP